MFRLARWVIAGEIGVDHSCCWRIEKDEPCAEATAQEDASIATLVRPLADNFDRLVLRQRPRCGSRESVNDQRPALLVPATVLRERQVVGAVGTGEVLPRRRVWIVDACARVVDAVPLHEESVLDIVRTRRQLLPETRDVDHVVLGDFLGRQLAVVDADCRDFAVPGIFVVLPGSDHHQVVARPEVVVDRIVRTQDAIAIHGCGRCVGVGENAHHRAQRTQVVGFVMPIDA